LTVIQEYRKLLADNFKGLRVREPLFYNWENGLRFELQIGDISNSIRKIVDSEGNIVSSKVVVDTEEYFQEVTNRATQIFLSAFDKSDKVLLLLMDYKYKRRKIRITNFIFNQIKSLKKAEVSYSKESRLYERNDRFDIRNIAIIKVSVDRINFKNIIKAIACKDFPPRKPRLDKYGYLTSKEIYFLNIDKKIILNMYDDRGLDIISTNKETLRPLYIKYNDWILDHDREKINNMFI